IGSHMAGKLALYFPRLELIISYIQFGIDTPYPPLINRFKSYLLSCWYQVKSYLENDDKKEVAAVYGIIDQMGHTFLNTIPGYENFAEESKLQQLDRVLVGNSVFMDIGKIFPEEITTEKLTHNMGDKWQLFKNILERQCMSFLISQNPLYITEKLAERIYVAASKNCKNSAPSFQQELEEAQKCSPLILFQLRVDKRLWSNQIEGTASIISSLYSDFPNLGIILDGWSCKETGNHPQDELAIEKEKITANQIISMIPGDVKTYITIGHNLYEKVLWAKAIDLFVASWGSNLTVFSHIVNKPGVAYGNSYWLEHIRELKAWSARENYIRPILVESNAVKDRIPNNAGSSYTLQWQAIYRVVTQLITKN
ncbi:MAG: hypothetical protein F6K39_35280, partial [Okeania sp. SIO3B3]|nr:hypothetical protein [Okeania sp. SIO3B3]